jgi:peptidoglycan hydrolase-like protein with peptidoglycan-binding domain
VVGAFQTTIAQTIFEVVEGDVVNVAPVANGATVAVSGASVDITLSATDANGNALTYTTNSSSLQYGSLVGSGSNYVYQVTATDRSNDLTDYFTFTANDGSLTSNTATITVNIPKQGIIETIVEVIKKASKKGGGGGGGSTIKKPVTTPIAPVIPVNQTFKTLTVGSKGEDVRQLQKLLNASGFKIAVVGAGSPGKETTTFGQATRAALVKYQIAKGIPATGTYIVVGTTVPNTSVTTGIPTTRVTFTRDLRVGSSGADVKKLQQVLNNSGYIISTTGVGSKGNEGTYFGAKTSAALLKFQQARGLPAVGWVGPKTRVFLNKI